MRHAIFSQQYKDGDSDVTCWWGVSGDAMSFLVIDTTNGASANASFRMATDEEDSHGILECADGIHCIDVTGMVVYLSEGCVGGTALPMSASQLVDYLAGGDYPLSLAGVKSFLRDSNTE